MDYIIETTKNQIHSIGGIALVGEIMQRIGFGTSPEFSDIKDIIVLKAMLGLLVQGRKHFEEIRLFRDNPFFRDCLNINYVPAPETLRLYLERTATFRFNKVRTAIRCSNIKLLQNSTITPIKVDDRYYIPVDADTSPFDNSNSKKEGVSRTYKQFDGYHPLMIYIGAEGHLLDCELREGKQHCGKGTAKCLEEANAIAAEITKDHPLLFRMDAGNDSTEIINVLDRTGHYFIVKRNLRKESTEKWSEVAMSEGKIIKNNDRKTVYIGFHTGIKPKNSKNFPDLDVIFQVTVRHKNKDGTPLLFPDIEVETFWTNLGEDPATVIELYHDHGTSEQFHSELKTDMDVERLPSGKFMVNALVFQLTMLAFNILRFIGQRVLENRDILPYKTSVKRKRLRKVIDDLIRISVKIVSHSGKKIIKIWKNEPWFMSFKMLYNSLCDI